MSCAKLLFIQDWFEFSDVTCTCELCAFAACHAALTHITLDKEVCVCGCVCYTQSFHSQSVLTSLCPPLSNNAAT